MFCRYCGSSNTDDAKFCESCGKSLEVESSSNVVPDEVKQAVASEPASETPITSDPEGVLIAGRRVPGWVIA